jgi:hypothetical protein
VWLEDENGEKVRFEYSFVWPYIHWNSNVEDKGLWLEGCRSGGLAIKKKIRLCLAGDRVWHLKRWSVVWSSIGRLDTFWKSLTHFPKWRRHNNYFFNQEHNKAWASRLITQFSVKVKLKNK